MISIELDAALSHAYVHMWNVVGARNNNDNSATLRTPLVEARAARRKTRRETAGYNAVRALGAC